MKTVKMTFYFRQEQLDKLDELWLAMRMKKISADKAALVRMGLDTILSRPLETVIEDYQTRTDP